MATQNGLEVIAIEEHFMHAALSDHFPPGAKHQPKPILDKLFDLAEMRLASMDATGIDMQVLSHQSPAGQRLAADIAVSACRAVNDALATLIKSHPTRFAGFATLPTTAGADAAADELQRAVQELGMTGAMIHGPSASAWLDMPEFRPIFARAVQLNVPIYLHPAKPEATVSERYFAPYDQSHPAILQAAWGFGVETGNQAVRMILSGIFDEMPELQIILGHLGEALPFWLDRIDEGFARPNNTPSRFAEVFRANFHVTTSGFFSDPAFDCTVTALGTDRVMFAVDYPYASNEKGVAWLDQHGMAHDQKAKVFAGNARNLLRL